MKTSSAYISMINMTQIIIVMFLWSICFPVIVLGLPYAPHLTFAALRAFLAGIALLIPAYCLNKQQPHGIKIWLKLAAIGLGATTLGFYGMFHASEFVSPGIATVIANTQPLMAMVLAYIFLNERMDTRGKIGVSFGFIGIVIISFPSLTSDASGNYTLGVLYIILAAVGITVSNVLIRHIAGQIDALTAMGWQLVIGSFFLGLIALFTEDITAINWNMPFISSLLLLALPGTALAYWLWFRVLEQIDLTRANSFSFLVPIFGLVMGVIFYQEQIQLTTLAGVSLTIIGIIFVNLPRQQLAIINRR
tara:strand:- start:14522 stop:15439 length:918 start_codon:yes stop_codon:yes gene_type:complete